MADKPQHWIEPNFTVEFAHDCTAVQVRASEGEWVSFLAAGSQKLIIFKDINANRVAAEMMGVDQVSGAATIAVRQFFAISMNGKIKRMNLKFFVVAPFGDQIAMRSYFYSLGFLHEGH